MNISEKDLITIVNQITEDFRQSLLVALIPVKAQNVKAPSDNSPWTKQQHRWVRQVYRAILAFNGTVEKEDRFKTKEIVQYMNYIMNTHRSKSTLRQVWEDSLTYTTLPEGDILYDFNFTNIANDMLSARTHYR